MVGKTAGATAIQAYTDLNFSHACQTALTLARTGNKYLDDQAPWSLYKQGKLDLVQAILYTVLESVRLAALILAPIIPDTATKIYQQLGYGLDFNDPETLKNLATHYQWGILTPGQPLATPEPVFQKLMPPDPIAV
jgi:methionyl-tRNA synthetase